MIFFFFFSSRRRHTRLTCDWSSDVCSSDLAPARLGRARPAHGRDHRNPSDRRVVRSEERRVGKGVDLGGRRIIKKKKLKSAKRRYKKGNQKLNKIINKLRI